MIVLDSSALLASLKKEPGYDAVEAVLNEAAMSVVNVCPSHALLISRFRKSTRRSYGGPDVPLLASMICS